MTQEEKQEIINVIIEFLEENGSQVGGQKVRDLTLAEMTDENLSALIIPSEVPSTGEWVQTTLKTMMRPITNNISDLTTLKSQTTTARDAANTAAALANEKAGQAQTAANLANEKAEYAQTQGNYAKQKGDEASLVDVNLNGNILTVKNRNGSSKSLNVKGEKGEKGDGIDYSTLTPAEKQALVEQVSEEIAQQQGYVLYPIEEGSITPTSMFRKNSIISINGVIYRAKQDTYNLPLTFVIEGERFVIQTLYGRTAFVAASNTVSNDWTVWADASNDIRFRQLEDRIAKLESIIK